MSTFETLADYKLPNTSKLYHNLFIHLKKVVSKLTYCGDSINPMSKLSSWFLHGKNSKHQDYHFVANYRFTYQPEKCSHTGPLINVEQRIKCLGYELSATCLYIMF